MRDLKASLEFIPRNGNALYMILAFMLFLTVAQLLYYLFDRHWTMPEEIWKDIVNDFAATFSITRHSLLESFVFYLLDDHTDEALRVIFFLEVFLVM